MNSDNVEIIVVEDGAALAQKAAEMLADLLEKAAQEYRSFTIALSGGSTPRAMYKLLAGDDFRERINWTLPQFFFGDERYVPLDDENSNYKLAWDNLLSKVPVPEANIHPVQVEAPSADAAAREYEISLNTYFGLQSGELPRFDLVFLGLGDDGHTASLFPGKPALQETERLVVASPPGRLPPPVDRVTLTFPALNNAAHLVFLVGGAGKADIIAQILGDNPATEPFPAQLIKPTDGKVTWLLDKAAAAKLENE